MILRFTCLKSTRPDYRLALVALAGLGLLGYGAAHYMGTVEGCTFCVHRVDRDETPACVEACNGGGNGAMVFGDLNDPQSGIATRLKSTATRQVRADLDLNTGVRYENI